MKLAGRMPGDVHAGLTAYASYDRDVHGEAIEIRPLMVQILRTFVEEDRAFHLRRRHGPLVADESILFTKPGNGEMRFMAHAFTDGRNKGLPISLGTAGDNFFVVIAERQIDTFMPFPVSAPPTSFALTATF